MYGRKYFGVARTTFVISKGGNVAAAFERVKPAGHEQQVLKWLREISWPPSDQPDRTGAPARAPTLPCCAARNRK